MAIKIGSNIASLQAQRRLGEATSSLSKVYERLSSGQRINRASDDAAGLAIAETLSVNSRVFAQGIRNVNDSLSLYSITEQATTTLKSIVVRSKELAEQSANGVYSQGQRSALDKELQALVSEYNRVLESTSFNSRKVFLREDNDLVTQAGDSTLQSTLSTERASDLDVISRVSAGLGGAEANGDCLTNLSSRSTISSDGRFQIFDSLATNLVGGDTNSATDIFIKDFQTGEIKRLSTSSTGQEGNGTSVSSANSLSADGRYVVFHSDATNLVSGDTNSQTDIFRKDLLTDEIIRVSTSSSGSEASDGFSRSASISADGRYVVFQSAATNLVSADTNGQYDIFRKDLLTGELMRASTSSSGLQASDGNSTGSSISADGRYVLFNSTSTDLVGGDTNGVADLFRRDMLTGEIIRVSTSSSGVEATGGSTASGTLSSDGRYVVFTSSATNLISGDTNALADIFRKDIQTGETIRVSTSSTGIQTTGGASGISSMSNDGRYVVFSSSATNLVPGDTNAQSDVFVKDLQTNQTRRVNLSENGSQTDSGSIQFAGNASISADGRYVFFRSTFTDQLDGSSSTNGRSHTYMTANPLIESYQLTRFQWMDVKTQQEARNTLNWLEQYETELNQYQGTLGATMSRLSTAASVLTTTRENYKTAESRIRDADVAQESANLIRTQILQQAASAVLAQANQAPSLALTLLR